MTEWRPYRESIRVTLARTILIAAVAAAAVAQFTGGWRRWPELTLLFLWPSFGGHWIDLLFLNWMRPRLPNRAAVQRAARVAVWFAGGILLGAGMRLTASFMLPGRAASSLTWAIAGAGFVAIELVAHAGLQLRGRPSFYNGLG